MLVIQQETLKRSSSNINSKGSLRRKSHKNNERKSSYKPRNSLDEVLYLQGKKRLKNGR